MLSLEEKRAALQQQLSALESQLDSLKRQLISGNRAPAPAPKAKPAKAAAKPTRAKKAPRAALKSRIFAALEKAGSTGVKVLDIAKDLSTNPANIYAWFHAAETRYPVVKRVAPATYRLVGNAPAPKAAKAIKPVKPAKAAKQPGPKPAKAPKVKAAKASKGGNRRGALQARIIDALKAAGTNGETVKSLSARFKMPYRNIQVWFATTGKRNPAVKKVGPATYQFAG